MSTADPSWKPGVLSPKQIGLVRHHLKELTESHAFAGSKRSQDFLQLIVEHALEGEVDSLRERMIGAEMFGRPIDYDTGSDSVVRVKATEVRKKLAQYYLEREGTPPVRIELPSGSAHFRRIPYDIEQTAEALRIALEMNPEERKSRMQRMRRVVREHNIYRWAGSLIGELCEVRLDEAANKLEAQSGYMPGEPSAEAIAVDQSVDDFRHPSPVAATGDQVDTLLKRGYGVGHGH